MAMLSTKSYYAAEFFKALGGGKLVRRKQSPTDVIADLWGARPSASLAKLLDFLGAQREDSEPALAEFMAFSPSDWLPTSKNAFDFMLEEPFRRVALLTHTLPLGVTGSGEIWLMSMGAREPAVFLFAHDTLEVCAIADSLETFAWVCHLADAACSRKVTKDEWALVSGKARGSGDLEVACKPLLPENKTMPARYAAIDDILGALQHGNPLAGGPAKGAPKDPAAIVAHALRAFLREDEDALSAFIEAARTHAARIVRDAAKSLSAKRKARGFAKRLEALGTV